MEPVSCDTAQEHLVADRDEAPLWVFSHLEVCPSCQEKEASRRQRYRALREFAVPELPLSFAPDVIRRLEARRERSVWSRLRDWLLPTSEEYPAGSRRPLLLGLAGSLAGVLVAVVDLGWQLEALPGLSLGMIPDNLAVPAVPALLGLLIVGVLLFRDLRLGDLGGPLTTQRALGLLLSTSLWSQGLLVCLYTLICYGAFYDRPSQLLAYAWPLAFVPALVWWLSLRHLTGIPAATVTFYLALGVGSLSYAWSFLGTEYLDRVLSWVGAPQMYYLRYLLPPQELLLWWVLLSGAGVLALSVVVELLTEFAPRRLLLMLVSVSLLSATGLTLSQREVLLAPGPEPEAFRAEALLLSRLPRWIHSNEARRGPSSQERSLYASIFLNHDLKRIELTAWKELPGFANSMALLRHLRPRRRGWWGTGPAGLPPLPGHPKFEDEAREALLHLPGEPSLLDWLERCQRPAQGRVEVRLVGPDGPVRGMRVRLFQSPPDHAGLEEEAARQLAAEVAYWGWTALLVTESDSEGRVLFENLPSGSYLLAVKLDSSWECTQGPGVLDLDQEALNLGILRFTRSGP